MRDPPAVPRITRSSTIHLSSHSTTMFVSGKLFTALLAVAAAGVAGSPVELEKRISTIVSYCVNPHGKLPCNEPHLDLDQCSNCPAGFGGNISMFWPSSGTACTLYE